MWIWRCWYRDTRNARPTSYVSESPVYPGRSVRGRNEAMLQHYNARKCKTIKYVDVMRVTVHMQVFQVPRGPCRHLCGRRVQIHGSVLAFRWPYKMFNLSNREVVSSRASLPSESETHVLSVPNMRPNNQWSRTTSYDRKREARTGTWVVDEVRLAVQKWCKNFGFFEFYECNVTRYYPETREGGLFAGYIDTFLKLKSDANGYAAWVQSTVDDERYMKSF